MDNPKVGENTLVVNVRRGDYYSVPEYRAEFGMDVPGYVRRAVQSSVEANGLPSEVLVISDDIPWCRNNLHAHLSAIAPTRYPVDRVGPMDDLALLSRAHRLILANSTFSFWGGYIGDATIGHREIWAPAFFGRDVQGVDTRSTGLRPHWHVIDEIPGGWGIKPEP